MAQQLDLDCGIAARRLVSWLDDELHIPRDVDGSWRFAIDGSTCSITVSELERQKTSFLQIERSRLQAVGHPAAIEHFQRLFTLRFISAGG